MSDSIKIENKLLLSLNYGFRGTIGGLVIAYLTDWNLDVPWYSFVPFYYPIIIALCLTAIAYFVFFRGTENRWKSTWIYVIINLVTLLSLIALFRYMHGTMK